MQKTVQLNHRLNDLERDLVEGCTLNNRSAQRELYYKYCNAMFSMAYCILNDPENAQDALQDAFIRVYRDIGQFRGSAALGAWIKIIAVRAALNILRRKKRLDLEMLDGTFNHELPVQIPEYIYSEILRKPFYHCPMVAAPFFSWLKLKATRMPKPPKCLMLLPELPNRNCTMPGFY